MVWQKKSTAPAYANLAEKVATIITGSADAWLLPWFNLMPGNVNMDVQAFCALGPPPAVEFDLLDFVGFIGGSRLGGALSSVSLSDKIAQWCFAKLFQVYCEDVTAGAYGCVDSNWHMDPSNAGWSWVTIGAATLLKFPGGDGGNIQNAWWSDTTDNVDSAVLSPQLNGFVPWVGESDFDVSAHLKPYCAFRVNTWRPTVQPIMCGPFGSSTAFVPPAITQPASAIPPTPKTYATISDLGAELDAIENKLHWVLSYTANSVIADTAPLVADISSPVVDASTDIPISRESAGFILTVANLPPFTDESFPEPRQLHRLGRVFLGNGAAWSPPIEVTVSPMLILKQSPWQTVVRVQLHAPATGTIVSLVKAPPVG